MRKFTKYPQGYVKASRHWREKTECKTKNGKIVHMQNVSSIFNDRDYYILYDADGKFVEQSLDFNDLHDKLYGIKASSTIKASSNVKYPVVTLSSERENITGRLDSGEFIQAIVKAMHQNDEFAMAMANFFDPEINNEIWEDTTYEEVAIGIIDFCKDQYREWKSLADRGREDNPFIIISEDESIVIS